MKRLILHWSAGAHKVTETDKAHYHFIIDGAGNVCAGKYPVEANEVFVRLTPDEAHALRKQECGFYDWGPGVARFVVSWDQPSQDIDRLVALLAAL